MGTGKNSKSLWNLGNNWLYAFRDSELHLSPSLRKVEKLSYYRKIPHTLVCHHKNKKKF